MSLHPTIQVRAQTELDTVIGPDRLPSVSDRGSLPYIEAVIKEVMRWHPILPLSAYSTRRRISSSHRNAGIARRTAQDDVYEGWFIPKGTIVIPNSWCVGYKPPWSPAL